MARQSFTGLVISQGKMSKTIKVRVKKIKYNRVVHKDIVEYKDFMVHDELNKCQEGDVVRIQYVRPLSAKKRFAVAEIMKYKGTEWMKYQADAPQQVAQEELTKLQQYTQERLERHRLAGGDPQVEELELLQRHFAWGGQNSKKVEEIQQKYGISSWPPTDKVIELEPTKLKAQLNELNIEIETATFIPVARQMLEQTPEKADEMLSTAGHDPATMKSSIKRNILARQLFRQYNQL